MDIRKQGPSIEWHRANTQRSSQTLLKVNLVGLAAIIETCPREVGEKCAGLCQPIGQGGGSNYMWRPLGAAQV